MGLKTGIVWIALGCIFLILFSGCSATQRTTQSARTAVEQLLQSEAISRSLSVHAYDAIPIPEGAKVTLNTTGLSADNAFVGEVVSNWLGERGYFIESPENAQYRINVIVNSLGTEYDEKFFGLPPVTRSVLPIATPELAIYKSQNQLGYVNFYLNVVELPSGRFIHSTSPYMSETFYSNYTVLFALKFNKTDLSTPPNMSSAKRIIE